MARGPRCTDAQERGQDTCDGNSTCFEGGGQNCQLYLCAGNVCGDSCGSNTDCDPNAFCNGSGQCVFRGNNGDSCQADNECFSGQCCGNICRQCCTSAACTEATAPVCQNNTCQTCTANPGDCPNGTCCIDETLQCVANYTQGEVRRESNICAPPCTDSSQCNADALCVAGICQQCDVFNGQDLQTVINAADAGETIYVCAGMYPGEGGQLDIDKDLTIFGAGDGIGGTFVSDRIRVSAPDPQDPPTVTLTGLSIKGQATGVVLVDARLTMNNCTVFESTKGVTNTRGTLEMNNCDILNNTVSFNSDGGGLTNTNGFVTLNGCLIQGTAPQMARAS